MGRGNPNWKPGQSGNPSGRPKNFLGELLRSKKMLPQEIYDAVHPLLKSQKEQTIIWAAEFLRDSAWGKPLQEIGGYDENGKFVSYSLLVRIDPLVADQNGNGKNGNGKNPKHQSVA